MIWQRKYTLEELDIYQRGSMVEHLGMRYAEIGADYLSATMPVDARTVQPEGILHGGASVALAETLGSTAANMCVDRDRYLCVGLEINANHLRAVPSGSVTGTARPVHIGRSTQVWEIRIEDESGRACCISRLTMAVLARGATPEQKSE